MLLTKLFSRNLSSFIRYNRFFVFFCCVWLLRCVRALDAIRGPNKPSVRSACPCSHPNASGLDHSVGDIGDAPICLWPARSWNVGAWIRAVEEWKPHSSTDEWTMQNQVIEYNFLWVDVATMAFKQLDHHSMFLFSSLKERFIHLSPCENENFYCQFHSKWDVRGNF
jgi:hypothetical protein